MEMTTQPLVTIVVISYNSAEYILETLESAKSQTYDNIELIISDDSSTDSTIKICEEWLLKNKQRFCHSKIIKTKENTGVYLNLIRGVKASNGEWIKIIAGDDILLPTCVEQYINVSFKIKFDWAISLMDKIKNETIIKSEKKENTIEYFFNLSDDLKYKYYLLNPIFLNPPTGFYRASVLKMEGIIDASFKLLEDQPIFLNLLKNKFKGYFLSSPTVIYRVNSSSITGKVNVKFYENLRTNYEVNRKP